MRWSNSETISVVSQRNSPSRRPFLVFLVPRGDMSSPLLRLEPTDRNFDLAVRFYDEPKQNEAFLMEAEYVLTGGLSKFHAAALFFEACNLQNSYEGYLFLDGDLEFDASRLSKFLSFVHAANLDLAQPSVTRDSYCYWKMAYHQPAFIYRDTSFVEVMAPYLSRAALLKTLPTFKQSISTYGLDLVWPSIIGSGQIGVVDAFQIRHQERVDHASGNFYKYLKSIGVDLDEEERKILAAYNVTPEQAHSLRGYRLKRNRIFAQSPPSLVSVPLQEIEKRSDRQWVIDSYMWMAALGPSHPEVVKSDTLRPELEDLLEGR
jgi:hypothetical protein